ncbi:hypothetical protein [Candidatus Poriferisocius sp.]|uniref:hypothetical protein n=1 Tax=Candidatus Poriferisocius sp. TaxID=3101276 RepID=UPI003B01B35D
MADLRQHRGTPITRRKFVGGAVAGNGTLLWRSILGVVVILLSLAGCNNKESQSDSNQYFATSTSTSAFETLRPSNDSSIATPSVTPTVISATPTVSSTVLPPPTTTVPPNVEEGLQEITKHVIRVPSDLEILEGSYLESSQASAKQFEAGGPTPTKIIVSTHDCQLISIDTLTLEQVVIWHYSGADYRHFYCKRFGNKNEIFPDIEGPISYIENLEWIDSRYLLISLCCEPAAGRFEVIDTLQNSSPLFLALNGRYPSINEKNILLYNTISTIGSVIFDVNYDISDPDYPFYGLESESIFYTLSFDRELDTDGFIVEGGFILEVSWVGDDKIVFELWVNYYHGKWYPFIGIFNTVSHSSTFMSRGDGWTLPTGDVNGNLVVVEQSCNYVNNASNNCDRQGRKIVLLNPDTLLPYYEIAVQENIVDMDLNGESLLVIFSNGEMGIFNLSDGSYRRIADGITNAIWAE